MLTVTHIAVYPRALCVWEVFAILGVIEEGNVLRWHIQKAFAVGNKKKFTIKYASKEK